MEAPEIKNQKLVAQLIAAQKKIETEGRTGKANYAIISGKNIEAIAKKFGITLKDAEQLIADYFASELNK
jgi:DNA polymerase I-like protein with 3'-5' exonuclease and polymerase domains